MTEPTMKVGVINAPGTFDVQTRPLPQTAPDGWVLIDICAAGICGTDYHIFEGKHPFLNYPRVIGHELSGRVVQDGNGWTKGDLVVVNPYLSYGTCRACKRGKPNCCYNIQVFGVHRDGGLATRLAVPSANLYAADGLSPQQAAGLNFWPSAPMLSGGRTPAPATVCLSPAQALSALALHFLRGSRGRTSLC